MTFRKTNDWRDHVVDGWVTSVPEAEAKPAALDAMLANRALRARRRGADRPPHRGDADDGPRRRRRTTAPSARGGEPARLDPARSCRLGRSSPIPTAASDRSPPDYFPRPGGQSRMTVADVTSRAGDAARGEQRYYAASCSTCHRIGSAGADVGPELTASPGSSIGRPRRVDRQPQRRDRLRLQRRALRHAPQEPHIGFLLADGPTVSLRDGYGRVLSFDAADIAPACR